MRPRGLALGIGLALAGCAPTASAGPWSKEVGSAFVKAYTSAYWAGESLETSAGGQVLGDGRYVGLSAGVYAEVGLGHTLMVTGLLPYSAGANVDARGTWLNMGGGDAELALQSQLPVALPLALRVTGKLPLYANQPLLDAGGQSPYPMRGDGQIDITGWLCAGGSLWPKPLYGFVEVGYRHRTEVGPAPIEGAGYRDGLTWVAHGGYASRALRGSLWSQGVLTPDLKADATTRSLASGGLSLGARLGQRRDLWLSLDAEALLLAVNATRGQSVGVGLSWEPRGAKD